MYDLNKIFWLVSNEPDIDDILKNRLNVTIDENNNKAAWLHNDAMIGYPRTNNIDYLDE